MEAHAIKPVLHAGVVDLGVEERGRGELDEDEEGGRGAAGADFGCEAGGGEDVYELCESCFRFGGFWFQGRRVSKVNVTMGRLDGSRSGGLDGPLGGTLKWMT